MWFLWFFLVVAVSYISGVFGFAQIIGSLQNIRVRAVGATVFTILLWTAILAGVAILVHHFFYSQRIAYYVMTGIALIQVLASGKIS